MKGGPSNSTVRRKRVTRRVPAGRAKPRSNSAGVITPRPARWTRVGAIAPSPQAMVSAVVEHVPGAPMPSTTAAASSLIRSPPMLEKGAGRGVEGADLALDRSAGWLKSILASALSILAA